MNQPLMYILIESFTRSSQEIIDLIIKMNERSSFTTEYRTRVLAYKSGSNPKYIITDSS